MQIFFYVHSKRACSQLNFFLKIKNKKHIVILTYNIFKGKNINGKSNYNLKLLKIIHATIDTM